jgi:spore maturation protein CgeB
VEFVPFGYKPSVHFPETPRTKEERARFECQIAFIGTADADRLPVLLPLLREYGPGLAVYGSGWERFPEMRESWRGPANGRDYRFAIGGARACLGLVRKANRDWHTMRTFEIPACGGMLVAERSSDHLEFFTDEAEALLFADVAELSGKLRRALADEPQRQKVVQGGAGRVEAGKHRYRDRLRTILELARTVGFDGGSRIGLHHGSGQR